MSLNQELSEDNLRVIERFIVLMYDRTSPLMTVNECRRSMFTKKGRSVESIPPTQDKYNISEEHYCNASMLKPEHVV